MEANTTTPAEGQQQNQQEQNRQEPMQTEQNEQPQEEKVHPHTLHWRTRSSRARMRCHEPRTCSHFKFARMHTCTYVFPHVQPATATAAADNPSSEPAQADGPAKVEPPPPNPLVDKYNEVRRLCACVCVVRSNTPSLCFSQT